MSPEEQDERVRRAARRAAYHLLKAVGEVLAAVSAALEELADGEEPSRTSKLRRIDVE